VQYAVLSVAGLKGTMSKAELHVLRARLQGGILNKARRGELPCPLPVGFVYNANNEPVLDPDKQVQESLRFFFETFRRTASACAVVKAFHEKKLLFPRRLKSRTRAIWCGQNLHTAGSTHLAQSSLCRCIRIWPEPHSQQPEWRYFLYTVATRTVDAAPACSSGLHFLGAV
jgi:hypothetical protein